MWYNTPGELLIYFALAMTLLYGVVFMLIGRGRQTLETLALRSYNVFAVCGGLAAGYLFYLFFSDNYAFKYVYEYSRSGEPFFYVLSGFWGGQEGTYLLWLVLSAAFGYIIVKTAGQYRNYAMSVFAVVNLFFLLVMTKLSPFALLPFAATDGLGLNPLLRDPWMVIHPPVIFVGYAMAAVPFSIAMAALIQNDYSDWVKKVFPWVGVTAFALGAGNILGGFWAYKTLGWGGYWGWDPVENSSFIPWMISLAFLHGLIIERRTGALRRINLLLSALLFLLVIYGTFLTRSGVLADFSVHSFVDLGVNIYLVGFMILFLAGSAGIFLSRVRVGVLGFIVALAVVAAPLLLAGSILIKDSARLTVYLVSAVGFLSLVWQGHRRSPDQTIPVTPLNYNYFGREFSLFAGMTMLFIVGVVILFWTSLPLLTMAFSDTPRAADLTTYNNFALPLAVLMALFLTLSPLSRYAEFKLDGWAGKLLGALVVWVAVGFGLFFAVLDATLMFAVVFTLVATGLTMFFFHRGALKSSILPILSFVIALVLSIALAVTDYLYLLFFGMAAMAATANVVHLSRMIGTNWKSIGGHLTHFGFGIMLIGVLASSAFVSSDNVVVPLGESGRVFDMDVTYNGMENHLTHPNNRLLLTMNKGGAPFEARPELFFSERMNGLMRRPYINRTLLEDVYFAPSQVQEASVQGLMIAKGETKKAGDFAVTFDGFSMGGHNEGSMSGAMTVSASLSVAVGDSVLQVMPSLTHETGTDGRSRVVENPADFSIDGVEYSLAISQILADQKAVVLDVSGLVGGGSKETLVMDVSVVPMVNLVWFGAILILLGTAISFIRRRDELARAS